MTKDDNLRDFIKASQVTTLTDIALIIIHFSEQKLGKKWLFVADLKTLFTKALIPLPTNLYDLISKTTKSQLLVSDKTRDRVRYRLSQKGIERVEKILKQAGLLSATEEESALLKDISISLYESLKEIPDLDERGYIQEALACLAPRIMAYRASILMGWAGAIYHLRKKVEQAGFIKFCQAFSELSLGKVKKIDTIDDLEYYQEKDFLLVIEKMGIIDKAIRKQLENCLDLRNACGHPTQLRPQIHKVQSFFEDIIQYALSL